MPGRNAAAFREAFAGLRVLRSLLPNAKMLALTATATTSLQKCVTEALLMGKEFPLHEVRANPDREGVYMEVLRRSAFAGAGRDTIDAYVDVLKPIIDELEYEPQAFDKTVVYLPLVWCGRAHQLAVTLLSAHHHHLVAQFHAPQTKEMKSQIPQQLESGTVKLVFATEALGMGADVKDIRRIVHIGCPTSLETYMQQIGRAGRDGNGAHAKLFVNASDLARKHVDQAMRDFCTTSDCRREHLLNHFAHEKLATNNHLCCDNCRQMCDCDLCITSDTLALEAQPEAGTKFSTSLKTKIVGMLLDYFAQTNNELEDMFPEAITGLSMEFAKTLVAHLAEINSNSEFLSMNYGFIDSHHLAVIAAVINWALADQ